MSRLTWSVDRYDTGTSTYVPLSYVQTINFTQGRTSVADKLQAGSGTVTGMRPNLLPSGLAIGDKLRITTTYTGSSKIQYFVALTDVHIAYNIVQNMDEWTISFEDAIAALGRATVTVTGGWSAGTTTRAAAAQVCTAAGLTLTPVAGDTPTYTVALKSQTTLTNVNALTWFETLAFSEQAAIQPSTPTYGEITWQSLGWQYGSSQYTFSDVKPVPTNTITYNELDFGGLARNFANKVTVSPTASEWTAQTYGSGTRSYDLTTAHRYSTEANDIAAFLYTIFSVQDAKPQTLVISADSQSNNKLFELMAAPLYKQATLVFRGSSYRVVVEGFQMTATPLTTTFQLNLSSAAAYGFFQLDDAAYGVIGSNRLGI